MSQVEAVFPQINDIQDPGLREKVCKVWERAMKLAGVDSLESFPYLEEAGHTPSSCKESLLAAHVRAVTRMSKALAEVLRDENGYDLNLDFVIAGALLHDVGKVFLREGKRTLLRHSWRGTWLALDAELPEELVHIIATHSTEGDGVRRTLEAICVYHADWTEWETLKEVTGGSGVRRVYFR
jgi:putative nucleotidyltransferase with HDIG domain